MGISLRNLLYNVFFFLKHDLSDMTLRLIFHRNNVTPMLDGIIYCDALVWVRTIRSDNGLFVLYILILLTVTKVKVATHAG